jgi:hypothetical protein
MKNTRDLIDPTIYSRIRPAVAKLLSDTLQSDPPCYATRTPAEWKVEVERLRKEVSDCHTAYESHADKRKAVTARRKWEAYCVRLIIAEAYHKYHEERLLADLKEKYHEERLLADLKEADRAMGLSWIDWTNAETNLKEAKEALVYWETNTPKDAEEEEAKIKGEKEFAECVTELETERVNHFKNVAHFVELNETWLKE